MTQFGLVYTVLLLSASSLLAARNPWHALVWSFALLPWFGLDMDIGLRVTAFQLFVLPLVVSYILRGLPLTATVGNHAAPLGLFVGYAVIVSLAMLPFLPEAEIAGGVLRSPVGRSIVQLLMLFFTAAPLLIAARLCRSQNLLIELVNAYVKSCLMLAAIGYLQIIVWYGTGENPFPIAWFDSLITGKEDQYRSGMFVLDGLNIFRMSSFGGEPKNLGQALVIALLLLIWAFSAGIVSIARRFMGKALFLLVAIFLTQSTSAFLLLALGLICMILIGTLGGVANGRRTISLWAMGVIVVLVGVVVINFWLSLPVADLIAARTGQRFSESEFGLLDDFDAAVMAFLADDWVALLFGVGLGNVHLFADSYLAPDVAVFASGTSFVAKMGFLRIVSETGIFGAFLLLLFVFRLWRLSRDDRSQLTRPVVLFAVLAYLLVAHASLFFILAGATIGMISAQRRSASVQQVATLKANQAPASSP